MADSSFGGSYPDWVRNIRSGQAEIVALADHWVIYNDEMQGSRSESALDAFIANLKKLYPDLVSKRNRIKGDSVEIQITIHRKKSK